MLSVEIIPVLNDNYCYILHGNDSITVVDPGEAGPVLNFLKDKNKAPDLILITHRHNDHIGGVEAIVSKYPTCHVAGPALEAAHIPHCSIPLSEETAFECCGEPCQILDTPGHTGGHISFYFPDSGVAFTGDTLLRMGCGRLFEGDAATMYNSLQKIALLPDDTRIYCGHDYYLSNASFAHDFEPDNAVYAEKLKLARQLKDDGRYSVPVTLAEEKESNPFLLARTVDDFAKVRAAKDSF